MRTLLAGLLLFGSSSAWAQAVRITAGPIEPAYWPGQAPKGAQPSRVDAAKYLSLYGTAFLGIAGTVEGLPPDAPAGFHFPTLRFVFSAAARPRPQGGEVAVARGLQRLNAHIRAQPLDSTCKSVDELAGLEVLATLPDSILRAATSTDTTRVGGAGGAGGAVATVTRALLPEVPSIVGKRVGPLVVKFTNIFHHPSTPTQVGYLSDHREFGWIWYDHPEAGLEGTHRTGAILEVDSRTRYLLLKIDMLADWRSHGTWQRSFEIVLALGAEAGACAGAVAGASPP